MPSESQDDVCNQQMYQAVVGSLLYLSTKTRQDIAFAVSSVTHFCAKSNTGLHAVKRILRYMKGTSKRTPQLKSLGIQMQIGQAMLETGNQPPGYVFLLGGAAIN